MKKRIIITLAVFCLMLFAAPMTVMASSSHAISVRTVSEDGKTIAEGSVAASDGKNQIIVVRQKAGTVITSMKTDGKKLGNLKQYIMITGDRNRAVVYTFEKVTGDHTLEVTVSSSLQAKAVSAVDKRAKSASDAIKKLTGLTADQKTSAAAYIDQVRSNAKISIEAALISDEVQAAKENALKDIETQLTNAKKIDKDAVQAAAITAAKKQLAKQKITLKKKVYAKKRYVKLSWKRSGTVTGYRIYRKTNSGKYRAVKTLKASKKTKTVSWTNGKLKKGKKYSYRVRAYRTVGKVKVWSPYSNIVKTKIR